MNDQQNNAAPAASVPQGWKLVPVEPTQEMAAAYLSLSMKSWRQSYLAMLDAAPAAPAPKKDACYVCGQPAMYCASKHHTASAPAPAAQADTLHEVFVQWAKEHGLVLDRKPGWPDDYERTATAVAWQAFEAGYYAKGSVKTRTLTKTWQHPAMKLNRSGD